MNSEPDINRLLKILNRKTCAQPVLFEFIIDDFYLRKFATRFHDAPEGSDDHFRMIMSAFANLGYDYMTLPAWQTKTLSFPKDEFTSKKSRSLNEGNMIRDEESMQTYPWPDPTKGNYEIYTNLEKELPGDMKILACSDGGILENAIDIVGFESLCLMTMLQPDLTKEIFDRIGERLLKYYSIISSFKSVGVCMVNDDWGFKTQTMLPPETMRTYVFPWIKKIVNVIHDNGKPAILHSCGNLEEIMHIIIYELNFDGKHSYEDSIHPVEEAIHLWGDRIAIMGGIDVDFLCRKDPSEIKKRSVTLLKSTMETGGYALGSGNSIATYIPEENFLAMISTAKEYQQKY